MLYMAYGSNLNKYQMQFRCPKASVIGKSTLPDYRLVFRRGVLTIEPAEGFEVPVGIWDVTGSDIAKLDRYEGVPTFYYKREFMVRNNDGEMVRVFGYVMHDKFWLERPSATYMETCLQGYRDFGFDPIVLYEAFDYSMTGGIS